VNRPFRSHLANVEQCLVVHLAFAIGMVALNLAENIGFRKGAYDADT
jgi:hypothetical protein